MIELSVATYCENCENFEPELKTLFVDTVDRKRDVLHIVTCRCERKCHDADEGVPQVLLC